MLTQIIHLHKSSRRPFLVELVSALPVCVWSCILALVSVKLHVRCGKPGKTSNMGAAQLAPWENLEASWSLLAVSLNPIISLSSTQFNPVLTQCIRPKPGNVMLQSKGPFNPEEIAHYHGPAFLSLRAGLMLLHWVSVAVRLVPGPASLSHMAPSLSSNDELELQL